MKLVGVLILCSRLAITLSEKEVDSVNDGDSSDESKKEEKTPISLSDLLAKVVTNPNDPILKAAKSKIKKIDLNDVDLTGKLVTSGLDNFIDLAHISPIEKLEGKIVGEFKDLKDIMPEVAVNIEPSPQISPIQKLKGKIMREFKDLEDVMPEVAVNVEPSPQISPIQKLEGKIMREFYNYDEDAVNVKTPPQILPIQKLEEKIKREFYNYDEDAVNIKPSHLSTMKEQVNNAGSANNNSILKEIELECLEEGCVWRSNKNQKGVCRCFRVERRENRRKEICRTFMTSSHITLDRCWWLPKSRKCRCRELALDCLKRKCNLNCEECKNLEIK